MKSESDFHPRSFSRDGLQGCCKRCQAWATKKWQCGVKE